MKIAARSDEPNLGTERLGIDQLRELDVVKVELTADADHVTIELFFDECSKGADAQLTGEHHIERVGR